MHFRLAPLALLALAASASAGLIDSFDGTSVVAGTTTLSDTTTGGGVFGGQREIKLDTYGGTLSAPWSATEAAGALTLSRGSSDGADFYIQYGRGLGEAGRENALGTGNNILRLTFGPGTGTVNVNAQIQSWDAGYSNFVTATRLGTVSGAGVLDLDFAGEATQNFGVIRLYVTPIASGTAVALNTVESVPEPATMAVLGLGLAAFRRRGKR